MPKVILFSIHWSEAPITQAHHVGAVNFRFFFISSFAIYNISFKCNDLKPYRPYTEQMGINDTVLTA